MKNVFFLFALFVFVLLLFSCNNGKNKQVTDLQSPASDSVHTTTTQDSLTLIGQYKGELPCADCSGIETTLKLYIGKDGKNSYELEQIYKGKSNERFVKKGSFNTERGFENDVDATVFILDWDKSANEQSYFMYYSKDIKTLHKLNKDKELNKSNLNYTLKLIET